MGRFNQETVSECAGTRHCWKQEAFIGKKWRAASGQTEERIKRKDENKLLNRTPVRIRMSILKTQRSASRLGKSRFGQEPWPWDESRRQIQQVKEVGRADAIHKKNNSRCEERCEQTHVQVIEN